MNYTTSSNNAPSQVHLAAAKRKCNMLSISPVVQKLFFFFQLCKRGLDSRLFSVCVSVLSVQFLSLWLLLCRSHSVSLLLMWIFHHNTCLAFVMYTQQKEDFRPVCMMAIQGTPASFTLLSSSWWKRPGCVKYAVSERMTRILQVWKRRRNVV